MALTDIHCIQLRERIDAFKLECIASGKVDADMALTLLIHIREIVNANLPKIIRRSSYETQHDSHSGTLSSD